MSDKNEPVRISTEPDIFEAFYISQAFKVGNLVFTSGQAALDDQGNIVGPGDFDVQAEQVFKNLQRVLEAAGSSLDKVFKVTIYLTDMQYFPRILDLRKKYFSLPWPADTTVEVSSLALPGLMIEIEATAVIGEVHDK